MDNGVEGTDEVDVEALDDLEVSDAEGDAVAGGKMKAKAMSPDSFDSSKLSTS